MPAKRPTTPRPFSHLMNEPTAVALLASLPLSQPGLSAEQLSAAVSELGTDFTPRQVRDLMDRCRLYGAEITSDRRQPRSLGGGAALYCWSPTEPQLRAVEQADHLLLA